MFKAKKIDVCIIFEHANRELESALLSKLFLEKKGLSCEIVSTLFFKEISFWKLAPEIIIVYSAYTDKDLNRLIQFRTAKPPIVINLHSEQIVNDARAEQILGGGQARHGVYHISWGPYFTQALKDADVAPETIIESGNPRLDFFRPAITKKVSTPRHQLAEEFQLAPEKKWLIYAANAFHIMKTDGDNELWNKTVKAGTRAYHSMLTWFEDYLKEQRDIEFIYRPHPGESQISDEVTRLKEKYSNFHIISQYPIRDWLNAVDYCNSWMSTSCIEAYYLKKYMAPLRPESIGNDIELVLLKNYPAVIQEFSDFVRHNSSDNAIPEAFHERVAQFYHIDERYSCEMIADACKQLLQQTGALRPVIKNRSNSKKFGRYCKSVLSHKIIEKASFLVCFSSKAKRFSRRMKNYPNDYLNESQIEERYEAFKIFFQPIID